MVGLLIGGAARRGDRQHRGRWLLLALLLGLVGDVLLLEDTPAGSSAGWPRSCSGTWPTSRRSSPWGSTGRRWAGWARWCCSSRSSSGRRILPGAVADGGAVLGGRGRGLHGRDRGDGGRPAGRPVACSWGSAPACSSSATPCSRWAGSSQARRWTSVVVMVTYHLAQALHRRRPAPTGDESCRRGSSESAPHGGIVAVIMTTLHAAHARDGATSTEYAPGIWRLAPTTTTHAHASHTHAAPAPGSGPQAARATLHCLTGCAIGEVLGLVIGTALGLSTVSTIALAVGLAFVFGYAFTLTPGAALRRGAQGGARRDPGRRHRVDHRHGGRRQLGDARRPGRDGRRARQRPVLGRAGVLARRRLRRSPSRSTAGSSPGAAATRSSTGCTDRSRSTTR